MTTTKSGDGSEALVIRVHPANAKFFSIVVYDWCMRSTEMSEIDWRGRRPVRWNGDERRRPNP
jgi:hypothetical protein